MKGDVVRSEIMWSRQKVYRSPGGGGTHWGSEGQNQDRSGLRVCEVASIADLLVGQGVPRWGLQPFNAKPRLLVALHCIAKGGSASVALQREGVQVVHCKGRGCKW